MVSDVLHLISIGFLLDGPHHHQIGLHQSHHCHLGLLLVLRHLLLVVAGVYPVFISGLDLLDGLLFCVYILQVLAEQIFADGRLQGLQGRQHVGIIEVLVGHIPIDIIDFYCHHSLIVGDSLVDVQHPLCQEGCEVGGVEGEQAHESVNPHVVFQHRHGLVLEDVGLHPIAIAEALVPPDLVALSAAGHPLHRIDFTGEHSSRQQQHYNKAQSHTVV